MSNLKIVINSKSINSNYWRDLYQYRSLFYFLAWRDFLVRYKQTVIGILWSVLRPFLTIVIFTFLFNKLGRFPTTNESPYAIMVCAGMLPWQFFSNSFSESSNSLVANANLLTKVYFPRIIVPVSSIIVSLIDFGISLFILLGLCIYYHYLPGLNILFLPFFLILGSITAFGTGILIAALNVKYRDFRYIIPFIIQFGLYISPVGFSSSIVYNNPSILPILKWIYCLNPMVAVIDGFRYCISGEHVFQFLPGFILSTTIGFISLFVGIAFFRKTERSFADII